MFLLNLPLICFVVINSITVMESAPSREKPIRVPVKTKIPESPRVKPVSPIKSEIPLIPTIPIALTSDGESIPNDEVGEKIIVKAKTSRLIDDDSSGAETRIPINSYMFDKISLTPSDTSSDTEPPPPPPKLSKSPLLKKIRKKHKSRTRTFSIEPDITDELTNLNNDSDVSDGIKGQLMNLSKGMMDGVKDNIEDLIIDRKRTAKKTAVGTIGSFVIIVIMICMIVLIKKI